MPDITAVIFDMYETLVHNAPLLWVRTFGEICDEQGLQMTGQELWDRWKPLENVFRKERDDPSYPFKSYEQAWHECFEQVFRPLGKGDAAAAAHRSVVELGRREAYPETVDVIARLRSANHFRLGVLSNADNDFLSPVLKFRNLEFDAVVSSETARAYKPAPHAFRLITEALDVSAEACLYVGDSQYDDVNGAHSAGMRT
ncbi:MAG: HAD family hydrolase, partial [Dehalococcoidia bacterium]